MTETTTKTARLKPSPFPALILPLLYAACVMAVFTGIVVRFRSSERDLCSGVAFRVASEVEKHLVGLRDEASVLASSISRHADLPESEVARIATAMLSLAPYVTGVSVAPSALVRYHFPVKDGESLVGHDLLSNPERRDALTLAMEQKAPVFSGPFESLDGGSVLFLRYPVFNSGKFWGFVSLTLDFDSLMEPWIGKDSYPGFAFALSAEERPVSAAQKGGSAVDGKGGGASGIMIAGEIAAFRQGVASAPLNLQGLAWRLYVLPAGGWLALSPALYFLGVAALAGAVFLFALLKSRERTGNRVDRAVEVVFPLPGGQGKKSASPFPEIFDGAAGRQARERSARSPDAVRPAEATQPQARAATESAKTDAPEIVSDEMPPEMPEPAREATQESTREPHSSAATGSAPMPSSSPIQPPTPSETITIQFKGPSVKGQLYMPDVMLSGDPKDLFARLRIVEDEGKTGPRPEPLREQEPPPAPDSAKEKRREYRTAPNPKAVSILVVDDSEANRDIMGRMLALRGYEPEFAASGEEALARSTSKDFAIIFMDCFMPGMDGLKASKLIRSSKASAKTKIVGMSAKVGTQELERCRASGMNELLSKPFTLSQLTAMIQSLTAGGERAGGMHR